MLGIADFADDLCMSRSTIHRYVITLVALGYLEQGASRKYRLGLRVTDLGMSALTSTGLREHAHPYLDELRRRTSYSVSLGVLDDTEVLYVDRARSLRRGQGQNGLDLQPGSRLPAHTTAMGKLLLANLPDEKQRGVLASMKPTKRGPNTIASKNALREELEEVQEEGFAVNDKEQLGGRRIAVDEARQLIANRYLIVPNKERARRARLKLRARRLMIGNTNGGRILTLVVERTHDPTTWLIVTGWTATNNQCKMLKDQP